MNNQAKDLNLEKDRTKLLQTRKQKSTERELVNARKKESKLSKKTGDAWMKLIEILVINVKLIQEVESYSFFR